MAITTNLNQSPYFDDFDEDKNFHRILFKPSVAVQARELNQIQSIFQNQVERFGDNIFQKGTILSGGSFTQFSKYDYVKITDQTSLSEFVNLDNYLDMFVLGQTTGLIAKITFTYPGLLSQAPDLATLYVNYLNTVGSIKTFEAGEVLEIYRTYSDNTLSDRYTETVNGVSSPVNITVATEDDDAAPLGFGYGVEISDGIIYHTGACVRFDSQKIILTKYNNVPDGISVGFIMEESIVNSNADQTLLDNANGFYNYNAPGADRLKLTPKLTLLTTSEANADETFLPLLSYNNGSVIQGNTDTQFNSIAKTLAKRTREESGNYAVKTFPLRVDDIAANTTHVQAVVGKGVAYIEGNRVETLADTRLTMRQGTDTATVEDQDILGTYGNYIVVNDLYGNFGFDTLNRLDIYDTVQTETTTVGFTPAGTKIGEVSIRALTRNDDGSFKAYLFRPVMETGETFQDARSFHDATTGGFANIVLTNSIAKLIDPSNETLIFPTGRSSIKSIEATETDYVTRHSRAVTANYLGQVTLSNLGSGNVWPFANSSITGDLLNDFVFIVTDTTTRPSGYSAGQVILASSGVRNSDTSATFQLAGDWSAILSGTEVDIQAHYNVKKTDVYPAGKVLKTVYVKIDGSTYPNIANGVISLGLPDVYEVAGAWVGADYSESNSDIKRNVILFPNQTEGAYRHSFIKVNRGTSLTTASRILLKLRVFEKITTGSFENTYFCVDSYPVDDANTANTAAIQTEYIPKFTDKTGTTYDLRDCIDFRQYVANTVDYAETANAATIHTNSVSEDFDASVFVSHEIIAPNKTFETTYEYYIGRKDRIIIDEVGQFKVLEGAENIAPSEPTAGMSIAVFNIPPYPSLSTERASKVGMSSRAITHTRDFVPGYTMKDINDLERRLDRLEYYVSLNALEKSATDLNIPDANGLDRFKNGILVDNFENFASANLTSPGFSAGIDKSYKIMTPRFRTYSLGLKNVALSNAQDHGDVITLPKTDTVYQTQPYASRVRNCVTNFYLYEGNMTTFPEYDGDVDVTTAPAINFTNDLSGAFESFTEALAEFVPLSSTDVSRVSSVVGRNQSVTTTGERDTVSTFSTTTQTTTTTSTTNLQTTSTDNTEKVGDFVTDVNFSPYMRSKELRIYVTGLRPSTRFYFFFDGTDVNEHTRPAALNGTATANINMSKIFPTGEFGASVSSDENGVLYAIFRIPAGTFFVGDRKLEIMDVPDYPSKDSATSKASRVYSAYNFSYEKTSLEITTRTPSFSAETTSTVNVTNSTQTTRIISFGRDDKGDPIAQTFFTERNATSDIAFQLTKVDVFFQKKSNTNGVTLEIRNTANGYPGPVSVPFGRVHIPASEVNVSEDASVPTTFTFPAPVTLRNDEQYSFVVIPDANDPDYLIWISKTGLVDTISGRPIVFDNNSGTLFTSTNNSAWTAYQDENIKYTLYRAAYTTSEGTVTMTNEDHEFFTLSEISGSFTPTESVYVSSANATGTIATVNGNTAITGTGTNFLGHSVGDYIVFGTSSKHVAKIEEITSATLMVVDRPCVVSETTNYFTSPVATFEALFDRTDPVRMVLSGSSAKSTLRFANGDTIVGADSGETATISTVDNLPVSFIRTNMYRTNSTLTDTRLFSKKFTDVNGDNIVAIPAQLSMVTENHLTKAETFVFSKSNEVSTLSGANSLEVDMKLYHTGTARDSSPIFDREISFIAGVEYTINDDTTDEDTDFGAAKSKFVSKTVRLADQMDAEDMQVYLTAYRPVGTDVKVYIRAKSETDGTPFENVAWRELTVDPGTNAFSSNANRDDWKEYKFTLPEAASVANGEGPALVAGEFQYKDENGSLFYDFSTFAIKIVLSSTGRHLIPRVKDYRAIALT